MVYREYTPVTLDCYDKGYFDLLVKRYYNGHFSNWFHSLKPGDTMDFRGPVTTLEYAPNIVRCLGMVAGGTGITPMYQIIRTVLRNPEDRTQLRLLYASRTEQDILLREELDQLAADHPDRLIVQYVVEKPPDESNARKGAAADQEEGSVVTLSKDAPRPALAVGLVSAPLITDFLPAPTDPQTAILVCGPHGMLQHLCGSPPPGASGPSRDYPLGGLLKRMGYGRQVIRFD